MSDFISLILFITILSISIIVISFLRKNKDDIAKLAKYKCIFKGVLLSIFGTIFLLCNIALFLLLFKENITTDKKSLYVIVTAVFVSFSFSLYCLKRGLSYLKYVVPKKYLMESPETMEFHFNVSRFKFLYAALLNPFDMSFKTAFSFYIIFGAVLFFYLANDYSNAEKVLMLVIAAGIQLTSNIFAFISFNKLYNALKKGEYVTIISPQGISRKTGNLIAMATQWREVEFVKYFKDYIVIVSKEHDYYIFSDNKAVRANIEFYYQSSRLFDVKPQIHYATFEETEEKLKEMAFPAVAFNIDKTLNINSSSSKIGGNPFVPESFTKEYPAVFEDDIKRPLVFLAQINCAQACRYDKSGFLPKSGMLYFFYDENYEYGDVYYYDGNLKDLKELILPSDIPYKLDELPLSLSKTVTLPDFEDFNDYFYDVEQYYLTCNSVYDDLKVPGKNYFAQMTGYASLVYESVIEDNPSEWILLFQCETSMDDEGWLYFYIKRDDILNLDFSKIRFSTQFC